VITVTTVSLLGKFLSAVEHDERTTQSRSVDS
jgi:hypothetical protein